MSQTAPARADLLRGLDLEAALTTALTETGPDLRGLAIVVFVLGDRALDPAHTAGFAPGDDERVTAWARGEHDLSDRPLTRNDVQEMRELHGLSSTDGTPLGVLNSRPLRYRDEPLGALVTFGPSGRELSEQQRAGLKLTAASLVTALVAAEAARRIAYLSGAQVSGLPGVNELHSTLDRELDRAQRYGQHFGVVVLELRRPDGSSPGREDRVAREAAEEIGRQCRISDFPFHLGGDRYALVLPHAGEEGTEKMLARLDQTIGALPGAVGLASGSAIQHPGDDKERLLLRADAALRGVAPPGPVMAPPPPAGAEALSVEPPARVLPEPPTRLPPAPEPVAAEPPVNAREQAFALLPGIDYYAALRVERGATPAQITNAYRDLSYRYRTAHREGDPRASDRFRVVTEAYRVLADPGTRARYDRDGPEAPHRERRISEVLRRPAAPSALVKEARRLATRLGDDHAQTSGGDLEKVLKLVESAGAAAPDDPLVGEAAMRVAPDKRYREGLDHATARAVLEQVASGLGG